MQKHINGAISELIAAAYFTEKEYVVSKPLTDFHEYDLIIDSGSLQRVQVKTVYWDNQKQRYLISCVTSHIRGNENRYNKKYREDSFDLLCAIERETQAIYLIPISQIFGRRSVTLYPKGKPNTVCSRYEDFEQYRVQ
jgi:hypothetical protein